MEPTPNRIEVHLPTHGEAHDTGGQDFTAHTARWVAFTADTGFWLIVFVIGYGHHAEREYPYFVESPNTRELIPAWLPRPPAWFGSAVDQMRATCASPPPPDLSPTYWGGSSPVEKSCLSRIERIE